MSFGLGVSLFLFVFTLFSLPCPQPQPSFILTLFLGSVVVDTMTELQIVRARKKSAMEAVVEWEVWASLLSEVSSHRAASLTLLRRFLSGVTSFSWKKKKAQVRSFPERTGKGGPSQQALRVQDKDNSIFPAVLHPTHSSLPLDGSLLMFLF